MSTPQGQFNFNYTKYQSPWISAERLDQIASTVFAPTANASTFSRIISCILLAVALAYIFGRKMLVDQEQEIEKQQYELAQTGSNQNEVNNQDPSPTV